MRKRLKKFWLCLGANKDQITSVSTVLQVLTVIGGVLIGINEFVIKDRLGQRDRYAKTLDFLDRNREFEKEERHAVADWIVSPFSPYTNWNSVPDNREKLCPLAEDFYSRLELGIRYGEFDERMCVDYFSLGLTAAPMYQHIYNRPLRDHRSSRITDHFHFAARVFISRMKNDQDEIDMMVLRPEREQWVKDYAERFPNSQLARFLAANATPQALSPAMRSPSPHRLFP
jgi:hypothetical protein